ncbi:MAG: WecB/TagA/CpsF family glycosyltransferase [Pseudomonadota bacterium]
MPPDSTFQPEVHGRFSKAWSRGVKALVTYLVALILLPLSGSLMLLGLIVNAWHGGDIRRVRIAGRHGREFLLLTLTIPTTSRWSGLNRSLWYLAIISGKLSWLGPKPVIAGSYGSDLHASLSRVKPGLFGPWWVRERTNIAVGNNEEADDRYASDLNLMYDLMLLPKLLLASLYGKNRRQFLPTINVLGLRIQNTTQSEAVEWVLEHADAPRPRQLIFVNPHCVNIAGHDRPYREAVHSGDLVLADGIGMQMAGRLLGTPFRQNVNGTDLFPALCRHPQAAGKLRLFLLGGHPGIAEKVADWVRVYAPGVIIAGVQDGFFKPDEQDAVIDHINDSKANVLLVAMGVPLQDVWIYRHLPRLRVGVAMGVGGLFDFFSDRIPRAPLWMRESGLEWVYRLSQEFGRMWRRYLIGNVGFILRVFAARAFRVGSLLDALADDRPAERTLVMPRANPQQDDLAWVVEHCQGARRAVVVATGRADNARVVTGKRTLNMMPLHGMPALQHVLESLLRVGVRQFDFILCEYPQAIEAYFGDGSRWGANLRYHLVQEATEPFSKLKALRFEDAAEPVWLVDAQILPVMPWLNSDVASSFRQSRVLTDTLAAGLHFAGADGSGWACLPASRLRDIPRDYDLRRGLTALAGDLALPCFAADEPGLSFSSPASLMNAQRLVLDGVLRLMCAGTEVEPGVWLARNVEVHPGARIIAPVQINEDVRIDLGAVIGPYACIGRGSVIARHTQVVDSLVEADTYVGESLDVHRCIVRHQQVYSHEHEAAINVVDSHLLNAVGKNSILREIPLRIRTQAFLLWLISLIPVMALRLYLGRSCQVSTRELVRTPASERREEWERHNLPVYAVTLWGDYPRYGWQHYFSLVFPALPQVIKGRLRIIGMPVRGTQEMNALDREARSLALSMQAGLIDECFVRQGPAERYAIEHAFVAHTSAGYDWRLFLRYMTQLLAPVPLTNPERYELEDAFDD